jgi:hypothetical protein
MTLKEWLDIFMDLDAYIAKGGRLLDLPMIPLEDLPPQALELIFEQVGHEKLDRLGRFYARCGVGRSDLPTGEGRTEEELRTLWRETAEPSTKTLH